jgi:hypothetical protein
MVTVIPVINMTVPKVIHGICLEIIKCKKTLNASTGDAPRCALTILVIPNAIMINPIVCNNFLLFI